MKIFRSGKEKGQAEIFGIAIVIVIIIFLFLFMLRFRSSEKPSTMKTDVTYTKLAWNFVNIIIKTNTRCNGISIGDLLIDCATTKYIKCDGVESCAYVKEEIEKILSEVFQKRGDEYSFSVKYLNEDIIKIKSADADNCRASDYANVPISTGREIMDISIKICR